MSVVCTLAKHDEAGLRHTPGSNRLQALRLSIKPWRSTVMRAHKHSLQQTVHCQCTFAFHLLFCCTTCLQAPRLLHAFVQYWFFTSYKKSSHICLAYAHRTFTANRLLEHDLKNVFNQLGLARAVVNVNQSDDMMLYLDDQNHLVMPSVTACDAPCL